MESNDKTALHRNGPHANQSYKILLIGGSSVGKTCLLRRYVEGEFPVNSKATLGLDFKIRTLIVDNDEIRLQLWDTSGQERFRSMTQAYYRGAAGIVLVFDVTAEDSFATLTDWLGDVRMFAPEDVKMILVGNKCDAEEEERAISGRAGEEFAKENGLKYFETSAVSNQNVSQAFEHLARLLLEQEKERTANGTVSRTSSLIQPTYPSSTHMKSNGHTSSDTEKKKSSCSC